MNEYDACEMAFRNGLEKGLAVADKRNKPMRPTQDKRKGIECYCPVCGSYVGWTDGLSADLCNYCSECGQRISHDVFGKTEQVGNTDKMEGEE